MGCIPNLKDRVLAHIKVIKINPDEVRIFLDKLTGCKVSYGWGGTVIVKCGKEAERELI